MRCHALLLTITLTLPLAARATGNFPKAIARDLQLSSPPHCTICHATPHGGAGTVVKPFGKYLVSRGLVAFNEDSLAGALAAAAAERHDTDGDGITDIDALKQGLDPNGLSSDGLGAPSYGCSSTGASGATSTLLLVLVVAHLLVAVNRRSPRPVGGPPRRLGQQARKLGIPARQATKSRRSGTGAVRGGFLAGGGPS
jgi:hypothetical protein